MLDLEPILEQVKSAPVSVLVGALAQVKVLEQMIVLRLAGATSPAGLERALDMAETAALLGLTKAGLRKRLQASQEPFASMRLPGPGKPRFSAAKVRAFLAQDGEPVQRLRRVSSTPPNSG